MHKVMGKVVLLGVLMAMSLGLAACVEGNRALSLLDTDPLDGNVHQFEVLKDGKVVYAPAE